MSKTKKSIISVLLAFIMLATCFATFTSTKSANALSEDYYDGYDDSVATIYYFADSYFPVIEHYTMEKAFPNYNVVYDIWENIDSATMEELLNNAYFDGLNVDSLVIIEIKNTLIASDIMETLFKVLKDQECKIFFLSGYDELIYNFNLYDYVYYFEKISGYSAFYHFIYCCIANMVTCNNFGQDSCIFLDSYMIDVYSINDFIYGDFADLCETSAVFNLIIYFICYFLDITYDEDNDNNFYNIVEELRDLNIIIFLYIAGTGFIDLCSEDFTIFEFEDYESMIENFYDLYSFTNFYAIGIWRLNKTFFNAICYIQQYLIKENGMLFAYLWVIDEIVYEPQGLLAICYIDIKDEYYIPFDVGGDDDVADGSGLMAALAGAA